MEGERLEPGSPARTNVWSAVGDPVIAILFLAGLFDGISDNWVHAALLWFVAGLLGWRRSTAGRSTNPPAGSHGDGRSPVDRRRRGGAGRRSRCSARSPPCGSPGASAATPGP